MTHFHCIFCRKSPDAAPTGLATLNDHALCEQCALTAVSIFQNKKPWLKARPADPNTLFEPRAQIGRVG